MKLFDILQFFKRLSAKKTVKIISNLMILILAFTLFTCWYGNIAKARPTSQQMNFNKIYLITMDKSPYWEILNQGASDMAAELGVTYIWDAPEIGSVTKQIEIIKNAVNSGANALLVAADDPKKISSVIEDAKARGVKVIYVDSPAYEEATVTLASDNLRAGETAGLTMLAELEKQGIKDGTIGIISVAGKDNTELRETGFRKVIVEDARFVILDTVYTNGDPVIAKQEAQRMIDNNTNLVSILGTNQRTTEGVGNAIKENNNKIIGIGFDPTESNIQLMNEGSLKALIAQNPYTMGYLGVAEAVAAILGKDTGPAYLNTGISVVRKQE